VGIVNPSAYNYNFLAFNFQPSFQLREPSTLNSQLSTSSAATLVPVWPDAEDQMLNFVKACLVLQPRQPNFGAAAR
jgi:hypothetical protein